MKITLSSGIEIGNACKPFVIAEVGSNWVNKQDCLDSIVKAKQCGANAVKFQAFNHHALYGSGDGVNKPPTPMIGSLPVEWLRDLKAKSDSARIEFMCSAFSPELVEAVDPYVNIHKVASAELTHTRILQTLAQIGKPVILSTGASGVEDIAQAIKLLGNCPIILLYCVAGYPAREIDLDCIPLLHNQFGTLVGFSDHSTDALVIPSCAVKAGAVVLEKHFTAIEAETPDRGHSLDVRSFRAMVDALRGEKVTRLGPSREEQAMVSRHNRRLIATHEIKKGDLLQEGFNFGIYRSLKDDEKALHPFLIDRVNGLRAKCDIGPGDGIGPEDV